MEVESQCLIKSEDIETTPRSTRSYGFAAAVVLGMVATVGVTYNVTSQPGPMLATSEDNGPSVGKPHVHAYVDAL